jgi:hypothetical protein
MFLKETKIRQHGKGKMKITKTSLVFGIVFLVGVLSGRTQVLVGGAPNPAETLTPLYFVPSSGTFWNA